MPPVDPLFKGNLMLRHHKVGVALTVLEGVFAGAGVDAGTKHLLRWLASERVSGARHVLDLGCGYGPLGLWLAAAAPERRVVAVDRDARALEATRAGATANGVGERVEVLGSLGYDDVDPAARFDLIVSNIPAKVGAAGLRHLLLDAFHHLGDEGEVAIVVVDRLAAEVAGLLADPAVELLATHPSKAYTAFEYRFTGVPEGTSAEAGFERGIYRRGRTRFVTGALSWEADVSFSLPEFDTLGHGTLAAAELLGRLPAPGTVVLDGAGQGHLGLALRAAGVSTPLRLVDRDLLALRTAASNLDDAEARHRARLRADDLDGASLLVTALPEREPVSVTAAVLADALAGLAPDAEVVLHGRTSDVGRVTELLARHRRRLRVVARAKHGAHAALRASVTAPRPRRR